MSFPDGLRHAGIRGGLGFSGTEVVGVAPVFTLAPVMSGTPSPGQTLSVTNGTVTGTALIRYTYRWYLNGVVIPGANSNTYVIAPGDVGTIYPEVFAFSPFGSALANGNAMPIVAPDLVWTARITPTILPFATLYAIGYGNSTFIAACISNTDVPHAIRSVDDGITWTALGGGLLNGDYGISIYGGGVWLLITQTNGPVVSRSIDNGTTWTFPSVPSLSFHRYGAAYGLGLFVIVATISGGFAQIVTSPDGVTWTVRAPPVGGKDWGQIQFLNGRFVVSCLTDDSIMYSDDGLIWLLASTGSGQPSFGLGVFGAMLVISNADGGIQRSTDGLVWDTPTFGAFATLTYFAEGKGVLVGIDTGTGIPYTTLDAITWTATVPDTLASAQVAFGVDHFAAVNQYQNGLGIQTAEP